MGEVLFNLWWSNPCYNNYYEDVIHCNVGFGSLGVCIDLHLGVGSGTIQDGHMTASSVRNASTPAKNGRLNYTSGSSWCAGTSDTNPYLQIDLQTLHVICAVSTQGNSQADQWVKNYTLQLSTNGTTWTEYKEGGKAKILKGNNDRNSEVKHVVYGVLTRYLRFLPKTQEGGVCMRTEMFGVEKKACYFTAIGLHYGGKIPDSSFTASSMYDFRYEAENGRLNNNMGRGWGPTVRNDPGDYLQIDLLCEYVICAVATQGSPRTSEWTTKYKIQLSHDGVTFITYQENNRAKAFRGNSNSNAIKKNSLDEFASARFIQFVPTAYHNWKVLRVEVYGVCKYLQTLPNTQ
ncbi:neuropilin-1-like isoform X3 [Stylophora pistillata]|uniref:neuropilin-1-like isoform X3 n=1 Tax=Stylophora pistillata TaxID=50429 RepID=UPI000C056766|nr:neuropilin-1-like isoform X3 [Stylophora pistillata]